MNDAAKYNDKTLDFVPDHVDVLTGSAFILMQLGRSDEAERFVSDAPDVAEVNF